LGYHASHGRVHAPVSCIFTNYPANLQLFSGIGWFLRELERRQVEFRQFCQYPRQEVSNLLLFLGIFFMSDTPKLQKHPQEKKDREAIDQILNSGPTDPVGLAELARLRIRYRDFPGALEIKASLDRLLQKWNLTEEELFAQTRKIHNDDRIYQVKSKFQAQEDWT
jgi:hypothetical protein